MFHKLSYKQIISQFYLYFECCQTQKKFTWNITPKSPDLYLARMFFKTRACQKGPKRFPFISMSKYLNSPLILTMSCHAHNPILSIQMTFFLTETRSSAVDPANSSFNNHHLLCISVFSLAIQS